MVIEEFIKILIKNLNTQQVYSNYKRNIPGDDTDYESNPLDYEGDFGISEGSQTLEEFLCGDDYIFGNLCANKYELQIYFINDTLRTEKLSGWQIIVTKFAKYQESDEYIYTNERPIFTGIIDSAKFDSLRTHYDIMAYDDSERLTKLDALDWWNEYWTDKASTTLGELTYDFLNVYFNWEVPGTPEFENKWIWVKDDYDFDSRGGLLNSSILIDKPVNITNLTVGTMLKSICEMSCMFPNMSRYGQLHLRYPVPQPYIDYTDLSEHTRLLESTRNDVPVLMYDGVEVYETSSKLIYKQFGVTNNTPYKISGNILMLNIDKDIKQNYLFTTISRIIRILQLIPIITVSEIPLTTSVFDDDRQSNFDVDLGDIVKENVNNEVLYYFVASQSFSGPMLLRQTIKCNADTLSALVDPDSSNDQMITDSAIQNLSDDKQDTLIAGSGITIAEDGRTISASGSGGSTILVEDHSVFTKASIGTGSSSTKTGTGVSVAKSGYTAIGIAGYHFEGTGTKALNLYKIYISDGKLNYSVHNTGSSSVSSASLNVSIIYVQN